MVNGFSKGQRVEMDKISVQIYFLKRICVGGDG